MKKTEQKETKQKGVPDYSNREVVFEVKKDGVSLDWTANLVEALSAAKATMGSIVYEINRQTGRKVARA